MKGAKIIAGTFVLLLGGVFLANSLSPVKAFSQNENRYLSVFPKPTRETVLNGKFAAEFENYAADQFLLRDTLISMHTGGELILGKKDSNGVYFGKDGYLLEKVDEVNQAVLQKNRGELKTFAKSLEERGISFSAMIVPTAPFVLDKKLPAFATQYNQNEIFDMLTEDLGDAFINVYPLFKENADKDIYYKTDHHWTTEGAFLAYQAYCEARGLAAPKRELYEIKLVSDNFLGTLFSKVQLPNIQKDKIYRFVGEEGIQVAHNKEQATKSLYQEEALVKRDQYSYFLNGNNAITEIETQVKNGKHLLVIKDSFAHCFVPFLTRDYEKITMIDYRYYNVSTEALLKEEITDVLVLYHAISFAEDKNLFQLNR